MVKSASRAFALFFPWLMVGCATQPMTKSGGLDVLLPTNNRKCVVNGVLNAMVSDGFLPKSQSDDSLVMERETKNQMAQMLLSSQAYPDVYERASIFFIPSGDSIRMVTKEVYVTNPGSAFEKLTPIKETQATQDQFQSSASHVATVCPPE